MSSKEFEVSEALLTSLLLNYQKPEDLIGGNWLLKQQNKLLVGKTLTCKFGELPIETPGSAWQHWATAQLEALNPLGGFR